MQSTANVKKSLAPILEQLVKLRNDTERRIDLFGRVRLTRQSLEYLSSVAKNMKEVAESGRSDQLLPLLNSIDERESLEVRALADDDELDEATAKATERVLDARLGSIRGQLVLAIFEAIEPLGKIADMASAIDDMTSLLLDRLVEEGEFEFFDIEYGGDEGIETLRGWRTIAGDVLDLIDTQFTNVAANTLQPLPSEFTSTEDNLDSQAGAEKNDINAELEEIKDLQDTIKELTTIIPKLLDAVASWRESRGDDGDAEPAAKRPRVGCALCADEAKYACGGCRSAVYCSNDCQRTDWRSGHDSRCADGR